MGHGSYPIKRSIVLIQIPSTNLRCPTEREVRKVIDSKVPAGKGYVIVSRRVDHKTMDHQEMKIQCFHMCFPGPNVGSVSHPLFCPPCLIYPKFFFLGFCPSGRKVSLKIKSHLDSMAKWWSKLLVYYSGHVPNGNPWGFRWKGIIPPN